jgi:hypothetical protein
LKKILFPENFGCFTGCPAGYTTLAGQDNCYRAYYGYVTRTKAAAICDSINSVNTYDVHLAYIETVEEQAALSNLIGKKRNQYTPRVALR